MTSIIYCFNGCAKSKSILIWHQPYELYQLSASPGFSMWLITRPYTATKQPGTVKKELKFHESGLP